MHYEYIIGTQSKPGQNLQTAKLLCPPVFIFARTDLTRRRELQYLKWISNNSSFTTGREHFTGRQLNYITSETEVTPNVQCPNALLVHALLFLFQGSTR